MLMWLVPYSGLVGHGRKARLDSAGVARLGDLHALRADGLGAL